MKKKLCLPVEVSYFHTVPNGVLNLFVGFWHFCRISAFDDFWSVAGSRSDLMKDVLVTVFVIRCCTVKMMFVYMKEITPVYLLH